MHESLHVVAEHRKIELSPLAELLTGFAVQAQRQWTLWLGRHSLDDQLPANFDDVLDRVAGFADPVMTQQAIDQVWYPAFG